MTEHVGMYFKKISEKLEKRANETLPKREVTFTQGKVLCYLHRREGEKITLRDIENYLDCSHATVSGIVSRLAEKGLVTVEQSEADRRAKNVKLTEKEWKKFRLMQEHRLQMESLLLNGFSEKESEELLDYLKRIYKNL